MPRVLCLALLALFASGCPRSATPDPAGASAGGEPAAAEVEAEAEAAEAVALSEEWESWYPDDITPPEGTQYPCALTALPPDLTGIPEVERRYIDHTYSMILVATQAKLPLLQQVYAVSNDGRTLDLESGLADYLRETEEACAKIEAEPAPAGLAPFKTKVLEAIRLQQGFFTQAVEQCGAGKGWAEVIAIPEGKQASGKLIAAWGDMQGRYRSWSPEVKDSVYHHLCALDLF